MRKIWIAAALVSISNLTHAQSSVTLYGLVDAGLSFNSNANGGRQLSMTSGNEGTTVWGLTGSEDLGGDFKAIFKLEDGFLTTNGTITQGGALFGRLAYVGLSGNFGTVTLGRQFDTAFNFVKGFESGDDWAAPGIGYGAHPGDLDNLDSFYRMRNALVYLSPVYEGFQFGGGYSFGGEAGSFTKQEVISFGASYYNGPFRVGVGYNLANEPNYSFFKDVPVGTTNNMSSSPVFSGYASAKWQQIISSGMSYSVGPLVFGAVYSNTKFKNLGSEAIDGLNPVEAKYNGTVTFNSAELNVKYNPTPALLVGVAYAYTFGSDLTGQGGARYRQINLGGNYSLSKRTSVYLVGVFQFASGVDSTGGRAVATILSAVPSSNNKQLVVTAGITHRF